MTYMGRFYLFNVIKSWLTSKFKQPCYPLCKSGCTNNCHFTKYSYNDGEQIDEEKCPENRKLGLPICEVGDLKFLRG